MGQIRVPKSSTDFPTKNAFQDTYKSVNLGGGDTFIAKLTANGFDLVYSTYLGGFNMDWGRDIATDSLGNASLLALLNPAISLQRMRSSKVYKASGTYSLSNLRQMAPILSIPPTLATAIVTDKLLPSTHSVLHTSPGSRDSTVSLPKTLSRAASCLTASMHL